MLVIATYGPGVFLHKKYWPRALEKNRVVVCNDHKLRVFGPSTSEACNRFTQKHKNECCCEKLTNPEEEE